MSRRKITDIVPKRLHIAFRPIKEFQSSRLAMSGIHGRDPKGMQLGFKRIEFLHPNATVPIGEEAMDMIDRDVSYEGSSGRGFHDPKRIRVRLAGTTVVRGESNPTKSD